MSLRPSKPAAALSALALLSIAMLTGCDDATDSAANAADTDATDVSARQPIDRDHLEAQLTAYVESYGRNWGDRRKFSGFVFIAQYGETLYARGFGFANREQASSATPETSFRIGSITKQFTAAAVLLLQQEGMLSTSDTIADHIAAYPAPGAAVTIHQLLTHTSGISDYLGLPELTALGSGQRQIGVDELLGLFRDRPLDFAPGERFAYSNSNYVLLGAIVEQASGMNWADFLAARLFEPAGLTHTGHDDAVGLADRAEGYAPKAGRLRALGSLDLSFAYAAGGLRSSAEDLARWHHALQTDTILRGPAKDELFTPDMEGYACGWLIAEAGGHRMLRHNGTISGFHADYRRIPDLDLVVVVWSNNQLILAVPTGQAAIDAALGADLEPVDEPAAIALDPETTALITGVYAMDDASGEAAIAAGVPADILEHLLTIELSAPDQRLLVKPAGQHAIPFDRIGPSKFVAPDLDLALEIRLESDGPALGLTITQGSLTYEYMRAARVKSFPKPTP